MKTLSDGYTPAQPMIAVPEIVTAIVAVTLATSVAVIVLRKYKDHQLAR